MSRSNNTEIINPATRVFEWSGSTGKLKYFDKTKGEKGENVFVELPFAFLVLDKLNTISGFSDADQSGFWANEVRNLKTEQLTVRTKKGIEATVFYANMAPVLNKGAQYAQSVYIAFFNEEKELKIGNIKISGSAIGQWIDFCKGKDIYKIAVTCESAKPEKKGATNYFVPIFKANPVIKPETEEKALLLDKELQEYLKLYFQRQNATVQEEPAEMVENTQSAVKELEQEHQSRKAEFVNPIGEDDGSDLPFAWLLFPLLLPLFDLFTPAIS